jgi:dihydroorotate dehydrogenase (NAD+) catalytic subunit
MGLPNPGIEAYEEEITLLKKEKGCIIGSIFGANEEEFVYLAETMERYGVDGLELNLSCPHAKGYGLEIGQDPDMIQNITSSVVTHTSLPVFVKLSPNVNNICILAKAVEQSGAHGIVAINTVKAMKIDIEARKPILANKIGGYSGKAIKPIGIRNVYEIYETVNIPIIGVGGITSGLDVIEYLMAGATAVQIGSALYYEGITLFSTLQKQVEQWIRQHNITQISELIGVGHQ